MENIVSRAGESVGSHTAVVFGLVGGLAVAFEGHNYLIRADVGVIDDIAAFGLGH